MNRGILFASRALRPLGTAQTLPASFRSTFYIVNRSGLRWTDDSCIYLLEYMRSIFLFVGRSGLRWDELNEAEVKCGLPNPSSLSQYPFMKHIIYFPSSILLNLVPDSMCYCRHNLEHCCVHYMVNCLQISCNRITPVGWAMKFDGT